MALKRETTAKIRELLKQNQNGLNITAIVRKININRNTAGRYLENLMVSGQVEMRQFGMAKIYRLAQRVPLSAMLSISSELIMLLDNSQRVIYANEVLHKFLGSTQNDLYGKNIEYTSLVTAFDDAFPLLLKKVRAGLKGAEWTGELSLTNKGVIFSCRIKPAVFEEGQRGVSLILEDITEQKHSEQRVKESEQQFRLLAENSLDMIHRHTPDDICIYISPASKTILGYDPDELIGHSIFEILHPEDAPIVPEYKSRLNKKNHTAKISYRVRHRDGHYVWLESVLRAIFDEKTGEFVEIYGVTRDISKRKKAEDALRESEATARALINAPTDSVILLDSQGVILELNETAALRFGKPKDELVGILTDTVLPDDIARARRSIISQVLSTKTAIRFEDERDGRWYDTVAYPVLDDTGDVTKIAIIARDITHRRQMENRLRESEENYRNLVERANDGICVIQDGVVKLCNRRITEFWGGSIQETLGRNFTDFVHPEAIPEITDLYQRRMAGEAVPSIYETRLRRKDGTIFYAEVNAGIVTYEGKPGNLIIVRDINDRKKRAEEPGRHS